MADKVILLDLFAEDSYTSAINIKHLLVDIGELTGQYRGTGSRRRLGQNYRK